MLILTSAGFKNPKLRHEFLEILPDDPEKLKLAHIITATKPLEDIDYFLRDREILKEMEFTPEEIDIEDKSHEQLKEILSDKDIIYVQGGNPYYLLKHARKSGFDKIVKERVQNGAIYIGLSAGSYIACPTIEMATWKDKDKKRKKFGVKNLDAMHLVPFLVTVHYVPKFLAGIKRGAANSKYPVKILTDNQALLVQDDKVKLIGEGKKVVI